MITTNQYTVDGTAVKIAESAVGMKNAYIHVVGNQKIYLGTSTVTSTTGLYIDKAAGVVMIRLASGESLYAIASNGQTDTVAVLIGE